MPGIVRQDTRRREQPLTHYEVHVPRVGVPRNVTTYGERILRRVTIPASGVATPSELCRVRPDRQTRPCIAPGMTDVVAPKRTAIVQLGSLASRSCHCCCCPLCRWRRPITRLSPASADVSLILMRLDFLLRAAHDAFHLSHLRVHFSY